MRVSPPLTFSQKYMRGINKDIVEEAWLQNNSVLTVPMGE